KTRYRCSCRKSLPDSGTNPPVTPHPPLAALPSRSLCWMGIAGRRRTAPPREQRGEHAMRRFTPLGLALTVFALGLTASARAQAPCPPPPVVVLGAPEPAVPFAGARYS